MLRLRTGCPECGTVVQVHRISGENATRLVQKGVTKMEDDEREP